MQDQLRFAEAGKTLDKKYAPVRGHAAASEGYELEPEIIFF
jgi:hypothetical protein